MAGPTLNIGLKDCKTCQEWDMAHDVAKQFKWEYLGLMAYDMEADVIAINEEGLMRLIMMLNPAQTAKRLQLVPQDLWFKIKQKKYRDDSL